MTLGFNEINLQEEDQKKIVTITFKGKVERADYELLVPQLEGIIRKGGDIRMMVELRDFEGWTPKALWEDTKFFTTRANAIEKIAIAGDKKWESSLAVLAKLFTSARIKFFDLERIEAAKDWIRA